MILNQGLHLAYCTNVHPGRDWPETFDSLNRYTLEVKRLLGCTKPFAVGLRLSDTASRELGDAAKLLEFQHWLDKNDCYVFTINGFPYGNFHGTRVKENVYLPDWTDSKRVEYTNRLFDLLAKLVPASLEGSVSTLPGSFKEFIHSREQERQIRDNIWACVEHIARTSETCGRHLHLGLEPEPLGLFENSQETAKFFDQLREEHPNDPKLDQHLGVNYDTCHFAVEFEQPKQALERLDHHGIRLSKIHISNALRVRPNPASLQQLAAFVEDVYLHQVIVNREGSELVRIKDLNLALESSFAQSPAANDEWRIHFHIPLHSKPPGLFETTAEHVSGLMQLLKTNPKRCSHLEMETYTWAVLPDALRSRNVCEQIVAEYRWTLQELAKNRLATISGSHTEPEARHVLSKSAG
jgi:hypothetical protein